MEAEIIPVNNISQHADGIVVTIHETVTILHTHMYGYFMANV